MRRVLVTGATGTLGPSTIEGLRAYGQFAITTSSRSPAGLDGHIVADLSVADECHRAILRAEPDVIIHLAGGTRGGAEDLHRSNVDTTMNIAKSLHALGWTPHVIMLGSAAEFGDPGTTLVPSDWPLAPRSAYGRAKAEQARRAIPLLESCGISWSLARPFNVLAPHAPADTPLCNFRRQLLAANVVNARIHTGPVHLVRDFIGLTDLVAVLVQTAQRPAVGAFNVCTGIGHSFDSLIKGGAEHLGRSVTVVADVDPLVVPIARVVGDPSRLNDLGHACSGDLAQLVAGWLGTPDDHPNR